jgi:AraC family transcriptional regulator, regulatory protein of adaptative response / DNA-3-methyladenine glycosylase II
MRLEHASCYRALCARDARFDGVFFVGVTTTRIYCRPVCTARTPGRDRCRFFSHAALAEREGFRPCLRCRPELAPGHAPIDAVRTVARRAAKAIEEGALNDGGSLSALARDLGLSSRQLLRVVRHEFGVSPIELAQTRRLLLAKQLLTETRLPIVQVAFASGFESVRRFNALVRSHYRLTPSAMRRSSRKQHRSDCLRLTLAYRPPFDWNSLVHFLAARSMGPAEKIVGNAYLRTVSVGSSRGWLRVEPIAGRNALAVEVDTSLLPALPAVLTRVRGLFDLDARPDVIAEHLGADRRLAPLVARLPGVRVPGSFEGFELALRAVLGQRISVKAATTLATRLATTLGEPIETPYSGLDRLSPDAERLADVKESRLTTLGISSARAATIRALARAAARKEILLGPSADPETTIESLQQLPGVGPWTAHYIVMRAGRWPDALPEGDLGLLKAARTSSPRALHERAEAWRPWRAYAAMLLWQSLHPVACEE